MRRLLVSLLLENAALVKMYFCLNKLVGRLFESIVRAIALTILKSGIKNKHGDFFMNYSKIALTIIFINIAKISFSQNDLQISGIAKGFANATKIIIKRQLPFEAFLPHDNLSDTAIIFDSKFSFNVKSNNADLYILTVWQNKEEHWNKIFLQPGRALIILNDSLLKNITVKENGAASDYFSFEKEIYSKDAYELIRKKKKEYKYFLQSDSNHARIIMSELLNLEDSIEKVEVKSALKWISRHPKSLINSYVAYDYLKGQILESQLKKVFNKSPLVTRSDSWGSELEYFLDRLTIGREPPNFKQNDTAGHQINLADFRGKYVLVDFWASWCTPCRRKTPELRKIFNRFQNKNFAIISISLDEARTKWIEAIRNDQMSWIQVSDLMLWKNKIALDYGITQIPFNLLLDEKGIIVTKNVWGEKLNEILTKRLK